MTLADRKKLALAATPELWDDGGQRYRDYLAAFRPRYILKLIECVETADKMHTTREYDAARATLDIKP